VDAAQVNAKYANGMLEISMPAPELAASKKIEISWTARRPDGSRSRRNRLPADPA
jgi:hypothetical protein